MSALVGVTRLLTYFRTRGLVRINVSTDTATNQTICSQTGAWNSAEIRAASAPSANQIEISPGTTASMISSTTMAISQKTDICIIPPMTILHPSSAAGEPMSHLPLFSL